LLVGGMGGRSPANRSSARRLPGRRRRMMIRPANWLLGFVAALRWPSGSSSAMAAGRRPEACGTTGEPIVFRSWTRPKERRLRRVFLPQEVVRGSTLEMQGNSVGRWVEETYQEELGTSVRAGMYVDPEGLAGRDGGKRGQDKSAIPEVSCRAGCGAASPLGIGLARERRARRWRQYATSDREDSDDELRSRTLEEIEELTDGRAPLRPVRHDFGMTSFGINA
jgi:hypothetical protein